MVGELQATWLGYAVETAKSALELEGKSDTILGRCDSAALLVRSRPDD